MANNLGGLPKQSLVKIGVCAGLLLLAGTASILPNYSKISDYKKLIVETEVEIERQKILHPVYDSFMAQLNAKPVKELPIIETIALTQDQVTEATRKIEETAVNAALTVTSVVPDPGSLAETSGQLLVNCQFSGNFFAIRKFFINLGSIPYVRHIEKVILHEGDGNVHMTLKLRLAVKNA